MANSPAGSSKSDSSVRCDQNDWPIKLEYIALDQFKTVRTFKAGYNSSVSLVFLDIYPDALFALKTITAPDDPDNLKDQENEKEMFIEAQNHFVPKLYRTFTDDKAIHLLMEFLPGGELYKLGQVSENAAKFYLGCLVEAIDHLHTRNIAHNDVKASNVMLDADGYAKLIDFGLAMKLEVWQKSFGDNSGTAECLPPEVAGPSLDNDSDDIHGRDRAADLWAMGVLLYELLTGISPFNPDNTDDDNVIFKNIVEGIESLQFPREHISEEAEDLIRNLCTYEPVFRLGYVAMDEIREHRWFNGFDWSKLRDRKLVPPVVPEVKSVEDMMKNFTPDVSENRYPEVSKNDSDV